VEETRKREALKCTLVYVFLEILFAALFFSKTVSPLEHDASYFLGMATILFALVVGGIGIASSIFAFPKTKRETAHGYSNERPRLT